MSTNLSTDGLVLAPDAVIDLQLHTVYSDGVWMPEDLIDHLIEQQFSLAAITDHDRPDIAMMLQQIALEKGFPLVVAAEMTTTWRSEMTDVLCYGFDPDQNALTELAHDLLRRQQENTREVYDYLLRQGCRFSDDLLAAILEKPSAQQPHELVALMHQHHDSTGAKSVGQMLAEAGITFVTHDLGAVVEATHRSGGVCLLAHPGRGDGFVRFDRALLDQLRAEIPIDGFEVYYPAHTEEQIAQYMAYAEKYHLLTSSGSDSHAPDKPPIPYAASSVARF